MKFKKSLIIEGDIRRAPTEIYYAEKRPYEVLIGLGKDTTGTFLFTEDGLDWLKENGYIDD